jgi:hypothetical protein
MNTQQIETEFDAIGARLKVREIAPRWRQGDPTWISPRHISMDIRRDALPHESARRRFVVPKANATAGASIR